ncbi:IclR family transcriptional regulator domain-containing protein [Pseudochelatococcus contaminans]|uniref:IclR family pca regulon transcriptional regulator n=1 Tax=Pseudochelatococcus contaminans TaxID=1538103 RepID=A0A7W5Z5V5_9HYPH|nr:IclR family transcriptional regulator C-terminal domain-containing protein [Pseudochelatococcus contaminans]MBB3810390.1 IclR family pca regulon transcriptional regulator [Pseudochelatococcus contaminans]
MSISPRDTMGGLAKGLAVIETFAASRPRQSITDVATASGLDRATARRCLLTLAQAGYADYDGKFFTLTPRVLRLGTACLATMPLPQIVQPWLDRLSDALGESTSVSILDEDEIVYVARAAQRKVMSIALMPGSRLPAYCTSMGRVLLAALPEDEARRRIAIRLLTARTPLTLTDPEAVVARIGLAREQGYAAIDQEVEMGLRSIAVPLLNARGATVAALNVGLPTQGDDAGILVSRYLPALLDLRDEIRKILH